MKGAGGRAGRRLGNLGRATALIAVGALGVMLMLPQAGSAGVVCDTSWTNTAGGDWNVAANWDNGVPTASKKACINADGDYTVTFENGFANTAGVALGGSSGTQTLQIQSSTSGGNPVSARLSLGADSSIGSHGVLDFTSTGTNPGTSGISATSSTIYNSGLIETEAGTGGARVLDPKLSNQGVGTVAIGVNTTVEGHVWSNDGTFTVGPGDTLTFTGNGNGFTQAGGTLTNNGTFVMGSTGTFNHTGGDTSGNPIELCGSHLNPTGPGAASFDFIHGTVSGGGCSGGTLESDVGSGDTVRVDNTDSSTETVSLQVPLTNHGTLELAGTQTDILNIAPGASLTNAGTLATSGSGGRSFHAPVTNNGTVSIGADATAGGNAWTNNGTFTVGSGATFTSSGNGNSFTLAGGTLDSQGTFRVDSIGTFTHTGGNTTGNPVQLFGSHLNPTGPGNASFDFARGTLGTGGDIRSDIGSGDVIRVHNTDSSGNDSVGIHVALTNHGVLVLDGTQNDVLSGSALTNAGVLATVGTGLRSIQSTLTNNGTIATAVNTTAANHAWTNNGAIAIGPGTTLVFSGNGNSLTQAGGTLTVGSGGALTLTGGLPINGGTVRGAGTITAPSGVNNTGGTLSPGFSPGVLTITGNYTQGSGGTLATDVNGSAPGTGYDRLAVTGTATLAGTLAISDGFTPTAGQTFHILTAGSRTGTFGTVTETDPPGSAVAQQQVNYTATEVTLQTVLRTMSIGNKALKEGDSDTKTFAFKVTLSAPSTSAVSVHYATEDDTAKASSDYVAKSGTLHFSPGVTAKKINVKVNGDTKHEPDETFLVNLSSPIGAVIADGVGTGTILNDD
jgi:fibronectin-binding autotransporter adhesin